MPLASTIQLVHLDSALKRIIASFMTLKSHIFSVAEHTLHRVMKIDGDY